MQWGLQKFAELRPDIFVKLEPTGNLIDSLAIQFAAGTAPHVALLSQSDFIRFNQDGAATSVAPPPEGMKWLQVYADRPDNRSLYPFSEWRAWYLQHRSIAQKGWVGEQTPAESLEACQKWGERHLRNYDGPMPTLSAPVYP